MKNSRLKINHAKKLLASFASEYKNFITTNYQLHKEEDSATGKYSILLEVKADIPDEWSPAIGDIIHNTRASLDLLITDLLLVNSKKPTKVSAFPIYELERDFLKSGQTKVVGIKEEAWKIIKKLSPFKEGNLKLWQLHQLDIVDKHRLIIPVISENKAAVIDFGVHMKRVFGDEIGNIPSMPVGIRPANREVSDGMVLFTADKTHEVPSFEFELTFGQGELLAGDSISTTLNDFISLSEKIINELELSGE